MYGDFWDVKDPLHGRGSFGVVHDQGVHSGAENQTEEVSFRQILDGSSNTLLISEGLVPIFDGFGGPIGETIYGNMGGSLFSGYLTPNSGEPDSPIGHCPQDVDDLQYLAPCLSRGGFAWGQPSGARAYVAARSVHPGGVNASKADVSVAFFTNDINVSAWRALATRDLEEVNSTGQ
jgi:hypothetical protein